MDGDLRVEGGLPPSSMLLALEKQGFEFSVAGDRLRIRPAERVTPALQATLAAQKVALMPIVWRLVEMRRLAVVAPRAVPYAREEARGGPGHCFSCGDPLERPDYYGRCGACDVAADVFYASRSEDADKVA